MAPSLRKSRTAHRRFDADQLLGFDGRRGDVRRGHDLRQSGQRLIRRRLLLEHVEAGAGDVAGLDGIGERRFVDQLAARRVDDAHAGLAGGKPRRIEEVPGLRRWPECGA